MASKLYTSFYEVKVDLGLYLAMKSGDQYTLDLLPSIAQGRYFWLVQNWNKYYDRFKQFASGDQNLEASLLDFERSVQSSQLGNNTNVLSLSDKFILYSPFLFNISFNEIKPNKDEKDYFRNEIARVQAFDISTFRSMVKFLNEQHNLTCDLIGLGDPDAAALRGLTVVPKKRSATVEDLQTLEDSLAILKFVEGIIVELKQKGGVPPNLLQVANNNLSADSSVQVNEGYRSFVAVPFEKSLAEMAYRYLGSAERWFELVTINNLKSPYVDMYGEKQYFVSSGSGNSITIPDVRKEWLTLGTKVGIGSVTKREQFRLVEKINDNRDGTLTVFLSGDRDLSSWKSEDRAFARVYYPGTINEKSMVYIPLEVTSPLTKTPTPSSDELRRLDKQVLSFGVDVQRDENTGDLLLDSTGDLRKCYGIQNVRQTIRNILHTLRGENQWHGELGIAEDVGTTWVSSIAEGTQIAEQIQNSILADGRFRTCIVTDLKPQGNSLSLSLMVMLKDSAVPIPLSFVE